MKLLFKTLLVLFFLGIISAVGAFFYFSNEVKLDADKLINYNPDTTTRIYDRNGELIANLFEDKHRLYVPFKEIPPRLIEALVAIEDTTFFEHNGVNYEAIFRAAIKDVKAMKFKEGASTLTQQLIKNTILTNEKKIRRKINEAILALKLERKLSKEEILERYLNEIYFGHRYYGIRTAALGYFRKELKELNLKEMAMLVGLPKAPSTYDPTRHLDLSLSRANTVLYRMNTLGWITDEEYQKYEQYRPQIFDDSLTKNKTPYIVDQILRVLKAEYPDIKIGGYTVHTTVDLELQELSKKSLLHGYEAILKRGETQKIKEGEEAVDYSDLNGAMVVLESKSGEVLALVGGVDYKKSAYNRAVQSLRQPGSSFKPFIYQVALDSGYSTQSKLTDISRTYKYQDTAEDKSWKPKNYSKNFAGMLTLRDALVHSRNLATITLVNELGLSVLHREIKKMAFEKVPADLSIALGTFGISPLKFSSFYTIFSNHGTKVDPILVKSVITKEGDEKHYSARHEEVTSPAQAYLTTSILRDVVRKGTGRKAFVEGIELAGKTGTTNDYKDAWFCGFSPEIQSVIWFGKDNNKPMYHETGGGAAGPVFAHFYKEYLKIHPETKRVFDIPEEVRVMKVKNRTEYFTPISKPPKNSLETTTNSEEKLLF
ncbi:MAG: PBP1A family penicillin-binding protein [Epsilonproteobacteria bacterium]|nr:PBP1A family penicillin-binding protein [Campylobacterota bacterium]